jgi:hypothetical protein
MRVTGSRPIAGGRQGLTHAFAAWVYQPGIYRT